MEEKDKNQKGQELLEVDEKGKPVEKKEEAKKPAAGSETFTYILAIVLLGLYLKIFVFYQNTDKTNLYHKYKTTEDMNRNVGETIIRYIGGKPKGRIDLASGSTPEGYPYC